MVNSADGTMVAQRFKYKGEIILTRTMRVESNITLIRNDRAKRENEILLFLLLCIVLLYPESTNGLYIYIPQIIIGIIAAYALSRTPRVKPTATFLFFAVYMMITNYLLLTINSNSSFFNVTITSMRLFYPFLSLIIGVFLRKRIKVNTLVRLLFLFLLLEFVFAILQTNNNEFRIWSYSIYSQQESYLINFIYSTGQRCIGTIGNPNSFGMLVIVLNSAIMIMSSDLKNKSSQNILNFISATLTLYIVINTQSRTSAVLLVITLALIIYWRFTKRSKNNIIILIVASLVAIGLLSMIQAGITRAVSLSELDLRFLVWQMRIDEMYERSSLEEFTSVFGIGYYSVRIMGFFDNMYLKVFVAAGITGLFVFMVPVVSTFKTIMKKSRSEFKQLAMVLFLMWIVGNMLVEYQEIFKLSTVTFILLGYTLIEPEPTYEDA